MRATIDRLPSIAEMAEHNRRIGRYWFSADTLRFFGQRMSDLRRRRAPDGRIVVYARTHRGWGITPVAGIASLAVYDPQTGEMDTPDDADTLREWIASGKRK